MDIFDVIADYELYYNELDWFKYVVSPIHWRDQGISIEELAQQDYNNFNKNIYNSYISTTVYLEPGSTSFPGSQHSYMLEMMK